MCGLVAFLLLLSFRVCSAQSPPAVPGYHERRSIEAHDLGAGMHAELLEDERITDATRPVVAAAYAQGDLPCAEASAPHPAVLCASIAQLPLRPALVRVANGAGREIGRLTLERSTAELFHLALSRHDSALAVNVDLSADAGSYAGPVVRFLSLSGGRLVWARAVDTTGRSVEIDLPTTLKTAWRADTAAARPAILLVACRPDLSGGDVAFAITYSRLSLANGQWQRRDRRVAGIWENDGDFPATSLFPPGRP